MFNNFGSLPHSFALLTTECKQTMLFWFTFIYLLFIFSLKKINFNSNIYLDPKPRFKKCTMYTYGLSLLFFFFQISFSFLTIHFNVLFCSKWRSFHLRCWLAIKHTVSDKWEQTSEISQHIDMWCFYILRTCVIQIPNRLDLCLHISHVDDIIISIDLIESTIVYFDGISNRYIST